jgi:putative ABC transport system permease protein
MLILVQDVRFALRILRNAPAFSAIAVLTFALGVGANIAIFSVVDAVALRGIGVDDPDQVVRIVNKDLAHTDRPDTSSWMEANRFRTESSAFAAIAAADRRAVIVRENGEAHVLLANVVSDSYFDVMRMNPAAGRTFSPAELSGKNPPPLIVISYDYWLQRYHGDPGIAGKTMVATDLACVIAGVLPRNFRGTELFLNPEVYVPISTWLTMIPGERLQLERVGLRKVEVFGRLKSGVTTQQGAAALNAIQRQLVREYQAEESGHSLEVKTDREARAPQISSVTLLLFGIGGLVLLIACANVANLLLVRAEVRRGEIASRLALGATRGRLIRQLLTETFVLGIIGAGVAVLLAGWVIGILPSLMPPTRFAAGFDFRLDARALLFGLAATIVCAIVAGLLPAFGASGTAPVAAIKESGTGGPRTWWRDALVASQIAVTVVLLIATALLARTLIAIRSQDPGFDAGANLVIAEIASKLRLAQEHVYYRQVQERIGTMPGVQGVAVASRIPLWGSGGGAAVNAWVPGLPDTDRDGVRVGFTIVSPDYFSTLGTRIVRGRPIDARDNETGALAAVINESAAKVLWPNADPIGRRFRVNGPAGREVEVVGIARDGRYLSLTEGQRAYMFLPLFQEQQIFGSRWGAEVMIVRTAASASSQAAAMQRALSAVDPNVLILSVTTMDDNVRAALYEDRLTAQLVGAMGFVGLLLASIGLFGVVSYTVTRRAREIGIRVALGANPSRVLQLVFSRALLIAGFGIAAGMAAAFALAKALASLVYGVSVHDPIAFGLSAVTMLVVAIVATAIPAYRALTVDPVQALKTQ